MNGKDVVLAYMDLQMASDPILLTCYFPGKRLWKTVNSFYIVKMTCVRVEVDVNEWFPVIHK